jgi:uncharacterized protein (TIGR02145 family)
MRHSINISICTLVIIIEALLLMLTACEKVKPMDPIIFNPDLTFGTVTDIDGNIYKTIIIGTQTWMAENLKTTKYRNGNLIGTTSPYNKDISGETDPKYQWAFGGYESNVAIYGRLYSWYAVKDSRNVCPTGWHIPSNDEWAILTIYLGGGNVAGGKLKETGTTHWLSPNNGATNENGFTALPGGDRYINKFEYIGESGLWWTSESASYTTYSAMRMTNKGTTVDGNYWFFMGGGCSVRCLRD